LEPFGDFEKTFKKFFKHVAGAINPIRISGDVKVFRDFGGGGQEARGGPWYIYTWVYNLSQLRLSTSFRRSFGTTSPKVFDVY